MKNIITSIIFLFATAIAGIAQDVEYGLFWLNSNVLEVRAVSSADILMGKSTRIASAQVTLKADAGAIEITQIVPSNLQWQINSIVESPIEDPAHDYFSFTSSVPSTMYFQAGTEVPLFTITITVKGNLSNVYLLDPGDAFASIPNSVSNNPGNSLLNAGGDLYSGNYHTPSVQTNLSEHIAENVLHVYPNPIAVGQKLTLNTGLASGEQVRVLVTSSAGQIVHDDFYTATHSFELDAPLTQPGVYVVQVIRDSEVLVSRIIVR